MKTEDFDKNFKTYKCDAGKFKVFDLPNESFTIHGVLYDEKGFHRIKEEDVKPLNDGVKWFERHTCGGRITFSTNSKKIYLKAEYHFLEQMPHMALTGTSGFAVSKIVKGKYIFLGNGFPHDNQPCVEAFIEISNKKQFNDIVISMPLYNCVKSISVGVDMTAEVRKAHVYRDIAPMLYYGSSITHGGCASRPDNFYEAYVGETFNVDYEVMGFSGSCKGEPEMAEFLARKNPSIFVLDYDHNAPDEVHLRNTHSAVFETFRKAHPNTPVIIMTRPNYYMKGKVYPGDKANREIIYETYKTALDSGDKNVYFIDGSKIYPASIREHCSVDTCHPTDLGFYFMGQALIKLIKKYKLL